MLFQNLKARGEEFSEICILFCKYIYMFIYIDRMDTIIEIPPHIYAYLWDSLCGLVVRVPGYPALPDFLSSGSGTGSTQPREYN
jgi:hypothetical protein